MLTADAVVDSYCTMRLLQLAFLRVKFDEPSMGLKSPSLSTSVEEWLRERVKCYGARA